MQSSYFVTTQSHPAATTERHTTMETHTTVEQHPSTAMESHHSVTTQSHPSASTTATQHEPLSSSGLAHSGRTVVLVVVLLLVILSLLAWGFIFFQMRRRRRRNDVEQPGAAGVPPSSSTSPSRSGPGAEPALELGPIVPPKDNKLLSGNQFFEGDEESIDLSSAGSTVLHDDVELSRSPLGRLITHVKTMEPGASVPRRPARVLQWADDVAGGGEVSPRRHSDDAFHWVMSGGAGPSTRQPPR